MSIIVKMETIYSVFESFNQIYRPKSFKWEFRQIKDFFSLFSACVLKKSSFLLQNHCQNGASLLLKAINYIICAIQRKRYKEFAQGRRFNGQFRQKNDFLACFQHVFYKKSRFSLQNHCQNGASLLFKSINYIYMQYKEKEIKGLVRVDDLRGNFVKIRIF